MATSIVYRVVSGIKHYHQRFGRSCTAAGKIHVAHTTCLEKYYAEFQDLDNGDRVLLICERSDGEIWMTSNVYAE